MYGWAGSETTGPGPLGGGMNSSSESCQPVTLSGEKLGIFAVSAPRADPSTAGPDAAKTQTSVVNNPIAHAWAPRKTRFDISYLRACCDYPSYLPRTGGGEGMRSL